MVLQTTFYIIGIICMSLIALLVLGLIVVTIIIAVKVHHIQKVILGKVHLVSDVVEHVTKGVKKGLKK